MVQIEIKNFQSIAHETIEVDGFSALAGKSNIGKSAIVRAVKAALTGAPADSFVRHGFKCSRINGAKSCDCFCSVHIKGEGLDLLWEKGDNVNRYFYNGSKYTGVGRGTPDFLIQDFAPVKIGDEKEMIQVASQFNPIFILNQSGTVAADVLSDVAKLNQINVAMRLAESDRKEASATRKIREKDIVSIKSSLTQYVDLDKIANRVGTLEVLDQKIETTKAKVEQLGGFIDSLTIIINRAKNLEKVNLVSIPDITLLLETSTKFETLEDFITALKIRLDDVATLSKVEIIIIPAILPLLSESAMYEKLVQWSARLGLLDVFFTQFRKIEAVALSPINSLLDLKEWYLQLVSWSDQIGVLIKKISQVGDDLAVATQEEIDVLKEFEALGVCDRCNRPFSQTHEC